MCNCSCQNEKSCLCEAGDSVLRGDRVALGLDAALRNSAQCLNSQCKGVKIPLSQESLQTGVCESELRTCDVRVGQTPSLCVAVSRETQVSPSHLLSKRREKMPVGKVTSVVLALASGQQVCSS